MRQGLEGSGCGQVASTDAGCGSYLEVSGLGVGKWQVQMQDVGRVSSRKISVSSSRGVTGDRCHRRVNSVDFSIFGQRMDISKASCKTRNLPHQSRESNSGEFGTKINEIN
jgi:hypothetical protein